MGSSDKLAGQADFLGLKFWPTIDRLFFLRLVFSSRFLLVAFLPVFIMKAHCFRLRCDWLIWNGTLFLVLVLVRIWNGTLFSLFICVVIKCMRSSNTSSELLCQNDVIKFKMVFPNWGLFPVCFSFLDCFQTWHPRWAMKSEPALLPADFLVAMNLILPGQKAMFVSRITNLICWKVSKIFLTSLGTWNIAGWSALLVLHDLLTCLNRILIFSNSTWRFCYLHSWSRRSWYVFCCAGRSSDRTFSPIGPKFSYRRNFACCRWKG